LDETPLPNHHIFFGFEFTSLKKFFWKKMGKNVQIQGKVVNNKKVAKNLK
jgi:hypothetical protein